jgi:hypothetical protein
MYKMRPFDQDHVYCSTQDKTGTGIGVPRAGSCVFPSHCGRLALRAESTSGPRGRNTGRKGTAAGAQAPERRPCQSATTVYPRGQSILEGLVTPGSRQDRPLMRSGMFSGGKIYASVG